MRAHPEVIHGLSENLAYLPNRFMSYFKEKLPTLSTSAGKQRFTQSIMMETLKNMPEFDTSKFNDDLYSITNKYAKNLNKISRLANEDPSFLQMSIQWSRNIITELALLAPRTVGATVGGGIGAVGGALAGAFHGTITGGRIGSQAGGELSERTRKIIAYKRQYLGDNGARIAGSIGYALGAPASTVGLGGVVGGTTGAATGAALGATTGAFHLATNGAQYGANAFENAGRYAYNKGSQLFNRSSNLTEANLQAHNNYDETNSVKSNSVISHTDSNSLLTSSDASSDSVSTSSDTSSD